MKVLSLRDPSRPVRPGVFAALSYVVIPALLVLQIFSGAARAQDLSTSSAIAESGVATVSRSYINPFRDRKSFRIFVMGDSLGGQLFAGLQRVFAGRPDIQLINWSRAKTGFTRNSLVNWTEEAASLLALERVDVAVVSFGIYDKRDIRIGRKTKHVFNSPRWREIYQQRVDRFLDQLSKRRVAVYWAGIPAMRSAKFDRDMREINKLLKVRAQSRSIKFVDTRDSFVDNKGKFRAWAPDRSGRNMRLRARDGIHFTGRGIDKYADILARAILSDVARTKAERNIGLAGEQQLVTKETTVFEGTPERLTSMEGIVEPAPASTKTLEIETAKPDRKKDGKKAQPKRAESETTREMRVVTSAALAVAAARPTAVRKQDRGQEPLHVKVLLLGEAIKSKPGRSDDFSWPRPN